MPNNFKREVKQYYEKIDVNYLITVHVRRGDYLNHARSENWTKEVFYTLDLDIICKAIQQYVESNRIKDFTLYVATDDLDYCKAFFQDKGLQIVTSENFFGDSLIVDLAAMAKAKLLICSNSSLSILGSMINNKARVFWRQTNDGKCISFDPRSTPVLYGPVLN